MSQEPQIDAPSQFGSDASYLPPAPHTALSNKLGIAGFCVSVGGLLLTCGILCPVGFVLSLIAAFKPPRGYAIAGLVIGFVGSIIGLIAGVGIVAGVMAAKRGVAILEESVSVVEGSALTLKNGVEVRKAIEGERRASGRVPTAERGNEIAVGFTDGWGRPFRYRLEGDTYSVVSQGADGVLGSPDDIDLDASDLDEVESAPPSNEETPTPR